MGGSDTPRTDDVINAATAQTTAQISLGSGADGDRAVSAVRKAVVHYSETTGEYGLAIIEKIIEDYNRRRDELGARDDAGQPPQPAFTLAQNSIGRVGVGQIQFGAVTSLAAAFKGVLVRRAAFRK
jgi:aldehyde dehydrogenase (NAD+)